MTDKINGLSRRGALVLLAGAGLSACQTDAVVEDILAGMGTGSGNGLTQFEAAEGIRAALANGTLAAVGQLGTVDGFLKDAIVRIALPDDLRRLQSTLSKVGMSGMLDELEIQVNRGAEQAAPVAKNIFLSAIESISISDAINIVRGPSNAATKYLQDRTTVSLTKKFTPIMQNMLQNTGAIRTLDQLTSQLSGIPFAPQLGADAKNDLVLHGVSKGLDGIFYYIGQEEAAIRANPAKRTSEILRKVFG